MVGNYTWDFEGRDVNDRGRKVTRVFLKWPKKTDKGWRWLCYVNRVSTIERTEPTGWLNFFGFNDSIDVEVIRYEALSGGADE